MSCDLKKMNKGKLVQFAQQNSRIFIRIFLQIPLLFDHCTYHDQKRTSEIIVSFIHSTGTHTVRVNSKIIPIELFIVNFFRCHDKILLKLLLCF